MRETQSLARRLLLSNFNDTQAAWFEIDYTLTSMTSGDEMQAFQLGFRMKVRKEIGLQFLELSISRPCLLRMDAMIVSFSNKILLSINEMIIKLIIGSR